MKLIVSDTHLKSPQDENYQVLIKFLEGIRDQVEHLYILGDLFQFWFGYRHILMQDDLPILTTLYRYREAGIPITYVVGNHDYHPGPIFSKWLNARIINDRIEEEWNNSKVHLAHGDMANPKDYGYRFLRFVLRSRIGLILPRLLPAYVVRKIAFGMSRTSHYVRDSSDNLVMAQKRYAGDQILQGADLVIQGHSHHPFLKEIEINKRRGLMANVGDGMTHYTCLIAKQKTIGLYRYQSGQPECIKELTL